MHRRGIRDGRRGKREKGKGVEMIENNWIKCALFYEQLFDHRGTGDVNLDQCNSKKQVFKKFRGWRKIYFHFPVSKLMIYFRKSTVSHYIVDF